MMKYKFKKLPDNFTWFEYRKISKLMEFLEWSLGLDETDPIVPSAAVVHVDMKLLPEINYMVAVVDDLKTIVYSVQENGIRLSKKDEEYELNYRLFGIQ